MTDERTKAAGGLPERVRRLRARVDKVDARAQETAAELRQQVEDLRAQLTLAIEWIDDRKREIGGLRDFQADVIGDLQRLTGELAPIAQHAHATPYTTDPAALLVRDGQGHERLGYVAEGGASETAYADFEGLFRGTRADIQRQQQTYLPLFAGCGSVLDLGCGRGEMLEVLRDAGIANRGVDLDAGMVAEAQELGLDAERGDLFDTLAATADGSVDGVFSAQVVEHLPGPVVPRLLDEVHRVLSDGGIAVIETVNPHSLRAFRFFWLDLTHTIPIYPETLLSAARSAGMAAAVVVFPDGSDDLATDLRDAGSFALVCAKDPKALRTRGLLA